VYYPIISESHPFFIQLGSLTAEYGDIDNIPDNLWPDIDNFSVLVKTVDFNTVGDIPDTWIYEDEIQGVVINQIESLDSDEKKLLWESFPTADLNNVLILDKGREPSLTFLPHLMIIGGVVLIFLGIGIIIRETKNKNKPVSTGTDMQ
jgi:hypothetical protein